MKRRIDAGAARDITAVLDWSQDNFGTAARRRYERLINRALIAVTIGTDPLGSRPVHDSPIGLRLYHLRNCRGASADTRVANPRHIVVYRLIEPDLVVIVRVLHDAMDVPSHFEIG